MSKFSFSGRSPLKTAGQSPKPAADSSATAGLKNPARRNIILLGLLGLTLAGCAGDEDGPPLPGKRYNFLPAAPALRVSPHREPVVLPPVQYNSVWEQPFLNAAHDPGQLTLPSGLRTLWTAQIGQGSGYRALITATPIVAEGKVFTADSQFTVTACDLQTGALLWQTPTQPQGSGSENLGGGLSFQDGILFAATGYGQVLALDPATGTVIRATELSSPARSAATPGGENLFVTTLSGTLFCLSQKTGKIIWRYQSVPVMPEPFTLLTGMSDSNPAFAGQSVVCGFSSGNISALNVKDGLLSWVTSLPPVNTGLNFTNLSSVTGSVAIRRNQVFMTGLGGLMRSVDLRTGRQIWQSNFASSQTPCVAGDWLFVLTTDQKLLALSAEDGSVSRITPLPQTDAATGAAVVRRGPLLASGRLILTGNNGEVLFIDPYTGKKISDLRLPSPAAVLPAIADNRLFIVSDNGTLSVYG